MRTLLLVALGGATGSTFRYLVSTYVPKLAVLGQVPVGTLLVNVAGGFLIGVLAGGKSISAELRYLLVVGFLGGFTTFSAFSWDTTNLATDGHPRCALLNAGLTIVLTLLATWAGYRLRSVQ